MLSTPSMSQTLNISVNATVESHRTRVRGPIGSVSGVKDMGFPLLQPGGIKES